MLLTCQTNLVCKKLSKTIVIIKRLKYNFLNEILFSLYNSYLSNTYIASFLHVHRGPFWACPPPYKNFRGRPCSGVVGNFSCGTLSWHCGHISYRYRAKGGGGGSLNEWSPFVVHQWCSCSGVVSQQKCWLKKSIEIIVADTL